MDRMEQYKSEELRVVSAELDVSTCRWLAACRQAQRSRRLANVSLIFRLLKYICLHTYTWNSETRKTSAANHVPLHEPPL